MSKILKNQTGSPILISDVGISVPASPASYTINVTDYLLWAASSNLVTQIGNGNIIVNDGANNLSISDGTDLIKGQFPSSIRITDGTDTVLVTAGGLLQIDGSGVTQPISAASLPLPAGASTSSLQTTGNTSLSSILTNQTNQTQFTKITDGTDTALVTAAGKLLVEATLVSSGTEMVDSSKATFSVVARSVAIGNNKSMFSILNADATKLVKIRQIKIINSQTSAVTGVIADFRILRLTGHSSGTSLTPETFDTNDSLDADITTRTGSTVAGESSTELLRYTYSSDEWGVGTLDVESSDHVMQQVAALYISKNDSKPITLRQNQGLTIKQVTSSTAGTFDIEVIFTQE
jgi:hypothetical protein